MTQEPQPSGLTVRCSRCRARVLSDLCWHVSSDPDGGGFDLIAPGTIVAVRALTPRLRRWVNQRRADLLANVGDLPDSALVGGSGCCEPDGAVVQCKNRHAIGRFHGDCHLVSYVVLHGGRVVILNE